MGPRRSRRFAQLNQRICEMVEEFGLVSFETLAVEDKRSMMRLQRVLDKATGYIYVSRTPQDSGENVPTYAGKDDQTFDSTRRGTAASAEALFSVADRGVPMGWGSAQDVQERWVDHRDAWKEYEVEERQKLENQWRQRDAAERQTKEQAEEQALHPENIGPIVERR